MADFFVNNPPLDNRARSVPGVIADQVGQTLIPQGLDSLREAFMPSEPGYHPSRDELAGFEPYTDWFTDATSRAQTDAIKQRIRANEAASQRIDRDGSLWTGLAAAALDPINYAIPLGASAGMGALRGALMSSITNAAGAGLQTWATSKVSPTEHLDDIWANSLYAGAFAGMLGGYIGRSGRGVAHELGTLYAREQQAVDARVGGVSMEHAPEGPKPVSAPEKPGAAQATQGASASVSHESGAVADISNSNVIQFPGAHADPGVPVAMAAHSPGEGGAIMGNLALKLDQEVFPERAKAHAEAEAPVGEQPKRKGGGGKGGGDEPPKGPDEPGAHGPDTGGDRFRVEPTGDGGYGLAPAYGIEKLFARLTLGPRLISEGVKAVGDIVQRMVGEGSVLTTDNLKGIRSPNSVLLSSKRWIAFAQDTESAVKRAWVEMRGQKTPVEMSGGNVSAAVTQAGDFVQGLRGKRGADALPTLGQFKEMLFRARVATDQAAYLRSLDPRVVPAIQKALPVMHEFYDTMGKAAVEHGLLQTKDFARRKALADGALFEQRKARMDELMAKEDPTPNEEAELHVLTGAQQKLMDRLSKIELSRVATDEELAAKVNEIQDRGQARRAAAATQAEKIRAQLVTHYEAQLAVKEALEKRVAEGGTLSQAQYDYLTDLKEKYGDGSEPNAMRDAINAFKLSSPIEPFVRKDPRFDPPANDHAVVIDKWEDRQGQLADEANVPPEHVTMLEEWLGKNTDHNTMGDFYENMSDPDAPMTPAAAALGALTDQVLRVTEKSVEKRLSGMLPAERDTALSKALSYVRGELEEVPEHFLPAEVADMVQMFAERYSALKGDLEQFIKDSGIGSPRLELPHYETGKPVVFDGFHGTNYLGPEQGFDLSHGGKTTGAASAKEGIFFARDPRTSMAYTVDAEKGATADQLSAELSTMKQMGMDGPQMVMARVRLDNPLVVDMAGMTYNERQFTKRAQEAKAAGHDGAIYLNTKDGGPLDVVYIAFDTDNIRYRYDPGVKKVEAETGVKIERRNERPKAANENTPDADALASDKQQQYLHKLDEIANGPALTHAQEAYVKDMLDQIHGGKIELPTQEHDANYINRVWNHDSVHRDPEKLKSVFEQWYREQGNADPKKAAADSVAGILDHDPQTQVFDPETGDKPWRINPSPAHGRVFDIPTERVADFLVTDTGHLAHDYARAFGSGIEAAKAFGDPFARDALHDVKIQSAREMTGTAQQIIDRIENIGNQLEFARDSMLGRQRAGTPLTMTDVIARALRNWVATTSLGGVGLTAIVEAARPIMTRGLMDTLGATFDILGNRHLPELQKMSQQFRLLLGEVGELAHGLAGSRVMEMGGVPSRLGSPAAMALDRRLAPFNEMTEQHFYVANGLAPVTDFLKNWTQLLSAHFMVRDIQKLAEGTASDQLRANLAGYGIDADRAARMVATDAFGTTGRVNIVDMGKFNDPELTMAFAQAVQMEVRRTVVTPGTFDKSMIQQGFYIGADGKRREQALMTLPFQFMSWGIAANNKVMISALQGRDASAFMGIAALTGMAYFVNGLKYGGSTMYQNMSSFDKLALAVEQSGALGQFTDLNNMIETGTQGMFGARPLLGLEPKWGRTADAADAGAIPFGPFGAKAVDIYKAFDPDGEQDGRASVIRRSVPFNGIPYLKGLYRGAEDMATAF